MHFQWWVGGAVFSAGNKENIFFILRKKNKVRDRKMWSLCRGWATGTCNHRIWKDCLGDETLIKSGHF